MQEFIKSPSALLIAAIIMLVAGAVLPFLMVIQVLTSTLLLNFIAYTASIGGLFLGVIAVASMWGREKNEDDYFHH